jgi:2-phospho-L-lactate guanylyltransferase
MSFDLVIAVRGGPEAKSRLAPALTPARRQALVAAMLEDMIAATRDADRRARLWLATPSDELSVLGARLGALTIPPPPRPGLNAAFAGALGYFTNLGRLAPILLLPGDLPLLRSADVEALAALAEAHDLVLAPAGEDGGTNAVGLAAATRFRPRFGRDSFARHRAQAERQAESCAILHTPTLALDLDRPDDLAAVLAGGPGPCTRGVLEQSETVERSAPEGRGPRSGGGQGLRTL